MDKNKKSVCFGSSYGWLIYIDRYVDAFLLNPFTRNRVQLHRIGSPLEIPDHAIASCGPEHYFGKAILSSDASNHSRQGTCFFVILMYHGNNGRSKLGFYKSGVSSWTKLDGCEHGPYVDITCHEEKLYALGRNNGSVEVWHLLQDWLLPVKKGDMSEIGFERTLHNHHLKEIRVYLVADAAAGDLLLVIKYLLQIDTFFGQDDHLKMPQFEFFKLDVEQKVWVKMASLGDRALFLGINDSISFDSKEGKLIQPDAVYFTDDDWYRDHNGLYKGYCMAVGELKANRFVFRNVYGKAMLMGQYPMPTFPRRTIWFAPHPW
ncbi:uncharacterized protein LOC120012656 [Tripterygium wilfordii]|uniref:uncharacterized protein LOC120012656 n=1 Tax=Tripterygium wilfordii TaxID=458696 RepID=UPI0018F820DD|nr:uncharacterized protein LOC120012656 [Tripterygium wilfordii]